jgi:hypothetical protein
VLRMIEPADLYGYYFLGMAVLHPQDGLPSVL